MTLRELLEIRTLEFGEGTPEAYWMAHENVVEWLVNHTQEIARLYRDSLTPAEAALVNIAIDAAREMGWDGAPEHEILASAVAKLEARAGEMAA